MNIPTQRYLNNESEKGINHKTNEIDKLCKVPKLRFPEFRDAGEWEEIEIREVFNVTRGEVLAMPKVKEDQTSEFPYPVYSSQTKNNGLAGYYSDFLYENAITWTTDGANAGDVNFRRGKFYCTNVCGVLLNTDGWANPFVAALLNTVTRKYVSYVGNPKLMNGVMSEIIIPIPSLPEQQKIADCLSTLDELIAAHNQKLAALKLHKKGLMQQLFPAEGETVPRLRFPEFRDAGEWEEKQLIQISSRIMDGTHFSPKTKYGSSMYLTSKNVRDGFIDLSNVGFISEDEHREIYSKCPVRKNDILLTKDGANTGNCAINTIENEFSLLSSVAVIRGNPIIVNSIFLYHSIQSDYFQRQIFEAISGQAITRITLEKINAFSIIFPSLPEQQRIADCLSSLDELIAAQSQKIEALKTHKRGLMQQLFPATEEVQG